MVEVIWDVTYPNIWAVRWSSIGGFHQLLGSRQYIALGAHLSWSSILVAHFSSHIFPKVSSPSSGGITGLKLKSTFGFGHLLWGKTNSKNFEEAAKGSWESFISSQGYLKFSGRDYSSKRSKSLQDITTAGKQATRRTKILARPLPGQWRFMGIYFPLDWRTRHTIREGFENSPVLRKGFCFLLLENMI